MPRQVVEFDILVGSSVVKTQWYDDQQLHSQEQEGCEVTSFSVTRVKSLVRGCLTLGEETN